MSVIMITEDDGSKRYIDMHRKVFINKAIHECLFKTPEESAEHLHKLGIMPEELYRDCFWGNEPPVELVNRLEGIHLGLGLAKAVEGRDLEPTKKRARL